VLTIAYLGMSLGIGVPSGHPGWGTLIPPLSRAGRGTSDHTRRPSHASGHCRSALCIVIVSIAGIAKKIAWARKSAEFDVKKGLLLAVRCGIFSSGMSFAMRCRQAPYKLRRSLWE